MDWRAQQWIQNPELQNYLRPYEGNPLRYLALFSGLGAGPLGTLRAGVPIERLYHADLNPFARYIFKRNFQDKLGIPVTEFENVKEIDYAHDVGKVDHLDAGWPCQDLTGFNPKGKGIEGDRSGLILSLGDAFRQTMPRTFAMENVYGAKSKNKGKDFAKINQEIGHNQIRAQTGEDDYDNIKPLKPYEFNNKDNTGMRRRRLFWLSTNGEVTPITPEQLELLTIRGKLDPRAVSEHVPRDEYEHYTDYVEQFRPEDAETINFTKTGLFTTPTSATAHNANALQNALEGHVEKAGFTTWPTVFRRTDKPVIGKELYTKYARDPRLYNALHEAQGRAYGNKATKTFAHLPEGRYTVEHVGNEAIERLLGLPSGWTAMDLDEYRDWYKNNKDARAYYAREYNKGAHHGLSEPRKNATFAEEEEDMRRMLEADRMKLLGNTQSAVNTTFNAMLQHGTFPELNGLSRAEKARLAMLIGHNSGGYIE